VTFDKVYDVIRDVVRRADSGADQWITGTIDSLGTCGTIRVSSAAKVIFLLQHLNPQGQRRIRVSAENVAALLYPRLGGAWEPHLKDVREACGKLLEEHFVGEEPETGYRFYRAEEQSFQKDVAKQPVDEGRLRELLYKSVEDDAKALGLGTLAVKSGHKLDVHVAVHGSVQTLPDPQARPTGLALHFVWPRPDAPAVQAKLLAAQYATSAHLAIWVLASGAEAEDLARRALKLEAGITDYVNRFGQQAATFLKAEQTKLTTLKEELIPQAVRSALMSGVTVYRGNDTPVSGGGKKPQDLFKEMMTAAVGQVYPQLEDGCVQVDEAGLRRVLAWKPPQAQPEFLSALKVFDDGGQPLLDRPFLKEILLSVQGRPEAKRTGKALLESFAEPPHGWPERAVKAGFGALLRARRLTVRLTDGSIIRSEADPKAENWLTGTQAFNKSVLELSDLNITPDERKLLTKMFADVFDRPGLDTIEKLEKDGPPALDMWLTNTRESLADLRGRQLPGADGVEALATVLQAATEPDLAAGKLKQLAAAALKTIKDGDSLAGLRAHVEVVQATARLRSQNKLGLLADVRSRTTRLYPAWIAEGGGATVTDHLEGLRAQVVSDELLRKPQVALDRDRRCFEAYARDYGARFRDRHERAQQARARIEAHPMWATAPESLRTELLEGIQALDPVGSGELTIEANPDGREGASGATYADLANHLELLDAREHRALQTLNASMSPSDIAAERHQTSSLTMIVASAADLPQLYERIGDLAKTALNQPRRVTVIFEDENR
jgi:hypothetical protein